MTRAHPDDVGSDGQADDSKEDELQRTGHENHAQEVLRMVRIFA
jgi:hypothetical protein